MLLPSSASEGDSPAAAAAPTEPSTLGRLSRDFVVYGLGEVFIKAFGLISIPIYTRAFDPNQYGVLAFVSTIAGLVSSILILGGDSAYARFFFEARTAEKKQLISSTWVGFLAVWSVIVSLGLVVASAQIAELAFGSRETTALFALALLVTPIALVNRMCAQVLRNEFRAKTFTTLNLISTALTVGFGLTAVFVLGLGLVGIFGGVLIAELVMLPVRLWTARSMFRPVFSSDLLRQMLAYGLPLVPTSIAYWVFLTSDRILLGRIGSLDDLGLYSLAASIVALTGLAVSAFGQAWSPHAVRVYEEDRGRASALFGQVMTYLLVGFGALAVCITSFGPVLVAILADAPYVGAVAAIGPLALAVVAQASTQVTAGGMSMAKRTQFIALHAWVAAVVNVALNLLLIPTFGMVGSAWAMAFAYLYLTIAYLVTSQRMWRVEYEVRRAASLVPSIVVAVVGAWWTIGIAGMNAAVGLVWCAVYVVLIVATGGLDRRELDIFRSGLRTLRTDLRRASSRL